MQANSVNGRMLRGGSLYSEGYPYDIDNNTSCTIASESYGFRITFYIK